MSDGISKTTFVIGIVVTFIVSTVTPIWYINQTMTTMYNLEGNYSRKIDYDSGWFSPDPLPEAVVGLGGEGDNIIQHNLGTFDLYIYVIYRSFGEGSQSLMVDWSTIDKNRINVRHSYIKSKQPNVEIRVLIWRI